MNLVQAVDSLLGVTLNEEKEMVGPFNTCIGLTGAFASRDNGFPLTISLSSDKSLKRKRAMRKILRGRCVTHSTIEIIIGEMGLSRNSVFSRLARCTIRPIYGELYSFRSYPKLHGRTLDSSK